MHIVWKFAKVILFFLLGLIILLFAAGFFIEPIAQRILVEEVGKAGKGQYSLQLKEVKVSLLQGNIRLTGLRFQTDTSREQSAPVVFAEAEALSVEGASWLTYLTSKRLFLENIYLKDLKLRVKVRSTSKGSPREPFSLSQLDIYPQISEQLKKVRLENLSLNNIDFQLVNISSQDSLHLTADRLDLHSKDILIDADKFISRDRTFYAGQIDLKAQNLQINRSGNKSWQGAAENFRVESQAQKMNVAVEDLVFLLNKAADDTLLFASLQEFSLGGLNLQNLQEQQVASLEKIAIRRSTILNYAGQDRASATGEKESNQLNTAELSLGNYLPSFIRTIELGELEVADIDYSGERNFFVENFDLLAKEVYIDSASAFEENRFLHAGFVSSNIDSLNFFEKNSGHTLNASDFSLHAEEGAGTISLNRLSMEPGEQEKNTLLVKGGVDKITLEQLNVQSLPEGKLEIKEVLLASPDFEVHLPPGQSSGSTPEKPLPDFNLYPAIAGVLQELRLGLLEVQHGSLRLTNLAGSQKGLTVPDFDLQLDDVLIAEEGPFEEGRVLHTKDIKFKLAGLQYFFPDQVYALSLDKAEIGTALQLIRLRDISYFVHETHKEALAAPEREQLFRLSNELFEVEGLNFQRLLQGEGLFARAVSTTGTDFRIYGDPFDEEGKSQPGDKRQEQPAPAGKTIQQQQLLANLSFSNNLPAFLPKIAVEELNVASLDVWQMKKIKLQNLNLQASSILLNELPAFTANRFMHARSLKAGFDSLWVYTISPRQQFMAAGLQFTSTNGLSELAVGRMQAIAREFQEEKGWVEADIPAFRLEEINTRIIPEGALSIERIKLDAPEVTLFLPAPSSEKKEKETPSPAPDFYPAIKDFLSRFSLGTLEVAKGNFRLAGLGGSNFGIKVPKLNLLLKDVLLAEGTAFAEGRILHSAAISMDMDNLTYLFPDKVYSLQLDNASLNTENKSITTRNFRYVYGENYELILEAPEVNEVYRFYTRHMEVEGVDFSKLFSNEGFYASLLLADSLDIYVFKNFNRPESGERTPMPAEIVKNAGIPLAIDALWLSKMKVAYEEMTEGADTAGLVVITDMKAKISNLSNVEEILRQEPEMVVTATGQLMEEGNFKSEISVPLLDETALVRVKGQLDTLDATHLNRIARFNSRVAIESGIIYEVLWDFKAGEDLAQGTFKVSYEDLSIQLSSAESPDTTGIIKDIGSFLANALVIDSSIAEEKTTEPKEVVFEQKRNKKRSFFHFYVQALLAGFMEALEVPFQ